MVRIFCRTLVAALLLVVPLVAQAGDAKPRTVTVTPIEGAKIAIRLGDCKTAKKILDVELKRHPDSTEALFLMGTCDTLLKDFSGAVPYYRQILVDHPDLVRVRLELARAEFETGDDEGADYNFRLALAEPGLPDTVVDNIGHYLAAIQSRKHYTYDVNVSVAPDSNINAAAASDHVTIFGLPFTVSQNSVQKSGVGIVDTLGGELFTDLSPNVRIRTGALEYSALYPGHSQFNDIQSRATIGPQWLFPRGDVSVLGVVAKQWYGDDPYNESVGARLEGDYNITKQLGWSSYFEGLSDSYHSAQYLNGYNVDQGNFLTYYFNPRTLVRLIGGVGYDQAESDPWEYWYYKWGVGVQFEFPWGITAYAQPDVTISKYFGADPFFLTKRQDRLYAAKFSVYKRDWNFWGFSPVATVLYTDNVSNIPIDRYHRVQFQLGFTKQF